MIGIIKEQYIFEFSDLQQLSYALSTLVATLGFDSCAIISTKNKPIGIIENGEFIKSSISLCQDTEYFLYANSHDRYDEDFINDDTGAEALWKLKWPFRYTTCRVPRDVFLQ